jgi:hypothetical protein
MGKIDTVNEYSSEQISQTRQAMYVYRTTVGRSLNRSCNGNPTVHSACIIELRISVTVNREKQNRQCRYNALLQRVFLTVLAVEKQCVLHILSVYL